MNFSDSLELFLDRKSKGVSAITMAMWPWAPGSRVETVKPLGVVAWREPLCDKRVLVWFSTQGCRGTPCLCTGLGAAQMGPELGTVPGSVIHEWETHRFPHVVMIKKDNVCEGTWKIEVIVLILES